MSTADMIPSLLRMLAAADAATEIVLSLDGWEGAAHRASRLAGDNRVGHRLLLELVGECVLEHMRRAGL